MPHAEIYFDLDVTAATVHDARHRIVAEVQSWGALDDEAVFRLGVVISELLTNSLLHGSCPITVEVALDHGFFFISVLDGSSAVPQNCEAGSDDECGRGLALVEELSILQGTDLTLFGKRCWAVLPSDAASYPDADGDPGSSEESEPLNSVRWSVTPLGERILSSLFPAT